MCFGDACRDSKAVPLWTGRLESTFHVTMWLLWRAEDRLNLLLEVWREWNPRGLQAIVKMMASRSAAAGSVEWNSKAT